MSAPIPILPVSAAVERFRAYVLGMELNSLPIMSDERDLSDRLAIVAPLCDAFADLMASVIQDAKHNSHDRDLDANETRETLTDCISDYVTGPLAAAVRSEGLYRQDVMDLARVRISRFAREDA